MQRNADLFERPREPWHGGNKIPSSYLNRMNSRVYPSAMRGDDQPDDFDDMPSHMQWFIRSICDMRTNAEREFARQLADRRVEPEDDER
jgi:hypothetical protein